MPPTLSRRTLVKSLALGLVGCRLPLAGPSMREPPRSFSQAMEETVRGAHLAGLAVATVAGGNPGWTAAAGLCDIAAGRPMTPDTIQNVASVSKLVTAALTMRLVADGRLALDGPIDPYIAFRVRNPAFPDQPISVRQLLAHTSSVLHSNGAIFSRPTSYVTRRIPAGRPDLTSRGKLSVTR